MKLVKYADNKLFTALSQKTTKELFTALCDNVHHSNESAFISTLQSYVTRVGIGVHGCFEDAGKKFSMYWQAIDFLCNKVLNNSTLYNMMRAVGVNKEGNQIKHGLNNVNIAIKSVMLPYNQMIDELNEKTGLHSIMMCKISSKRDIRQIPIFEERKSAKCGQITQVKYRLLLSPYYKADPYTKKIATKLTFCWPEGYRDRFVDITVINRKTNKALSCQKDINISREGKHSFMINVAESELDKRVLDLSVNINLWKKCKSKGFTFTPSIYDDFGNKCYRRDEAHAKVELSQLMKAELNCC